ncbi:MAG: hypothetical protein IEMM0008_0899 [bacterium]|nr:MAG: hypothetical protein IEMM0008_0899 [bacterium]
MIKKTSISGLILLFTFCFITPELQAEGKLIKVNNVKIEILTEVINIKRLPVLMSGVVQYLLDNDFLTNVYVKAKRSERVEKKDIRIYIVKYRPSKEIILQIAIGRAGQEGTIVRMKLGKYSKMARSLSAAEKSARDRLYQYYIREEMSHKEAIQYVNYTVMICEGIDRYVTRK